MERLFEGWSWGGITVKNVVSFKHAKEKRSVEKRFPGQYLIGIKISGRSCLCYRDEIINYSAGTAVYLPKESDESFEYYFSSPDEGMGVLVLFDSDTPLPDQPQAISGIDESARVIAMKLLSCFNNPYKYFYTDVMSCFFELMSVLMRDSVRLSQSKRGASRLAPAIAYIEEHAFDKFIDVKTLAELCSMTEKYFRNYFKRTFGIAPLKYINSIRANRIRTTILDRDLSVGEIAELCGFSDLNYFSRFFKKSFGVSPTRYRSYYRNKM